MATSPSARRPERIEEMLAALHGRKHLIVGNNDGEATLNASGWASVRHYAEIEVDGVRLVLCHYAFRTWNRMGSGVVNLHGHSHGRLKPMTRQYDVGVDAWDFRPVTLAADPRQAAAGRAHSSGGFPDRSALTAPAPDLGFEAPPLRAERRPRRPPGLWRHGRLADQLQEPLEGVAPVRLLRAVTLGGEDQHAVRRQPPPRQALQPRADVVGKRGRVRDVEAKLHGGRELVDVLPARPRGPDEALDDLAPRRARCGS